MKKLRIAGTNKLSDGFTVIELMIATAVFAVVLLLCSVALLQIGKTYYKGITSTQTQNVARALIDDISQAIQFSGAQIKTTDPSLAANTKSFFCVGNVRYTYQLGVKLVDPPGPNGNVITKDIVGADACTVPAAWGGAGYTELAGPRM